MIPTSSTDMCRLEIRYNPGTHLFDVLIDNTPIGSVASWADGEAAGRAFFAREQAARLVETPVEQVVLSVREAAEMIGVAPNTVRRMIRAGSLPSLKRGTEIAVSKRAVERWIEDQEAAASARSTPDPAIVSIRDYNRRQPTGGRR